jgi:hypothetical protein
MKINAKQRGSKVVPLLSTSSVSNARTSRSSSIAMRLKVEVCEEEGREFRRWDERCRGGREGGASGRVAKAIVQHKEIGQCGRCILDGEK